MQSTAPQISVPPAPAHRPRCATPCSSSERRSPYSSRALPLLVTHAAPPERRPSYSARAPPALLCPAPPECRPRCSAGAPPILLRLSASHAAPPECRPHCSIGALPILLHPSAAHPAPPKRRPCCSARVPHLLIIIRVLIHPVMFLQAGDDFCFSVKDIVKKLNQAFKSSF
jgi:hypothetical protein